MRGGEVSEWMKVGREGGREGGGLPGPPVSQMMRGSSEGLERDSKNQ